MSKQKQGNATRTEAERLLAQYHFRIRKEGWIKAALCGATVGFGLNMLYMLISLVFGNKLFWVGAILFLLGAATTPLFYRLRFRSTVRQVAARVDTLGLEERVLTMAQFEGDDSYMARRQREDAMGALRTVNASLLKLAVSVPLVVLCVTIGVLSATATTANAMVDDSLIKVIEASTAKPAESYILSYTVQGGLGGKIYGEVMQTVKGGTTASPVQAIADDGYIFAGWTDGCEDAFRVDADVQGDIVASAIFLAFDEDDLPMDVDPSPSDSNSNNPGGPPSNKSPKPEDLTDDNGEPGEAPEDGGGAGGSSAPSNQIIDGQTFYGDEYGNSLSGAQDAISSSTELSGEQSDTISDYFNNIAK